MNKFIKIFVALLIFTQCKSIGNGVKITQREVSNQIIIRPASDNKYRIITIQFPKEIILTNNSLKKYHLIMINYEYNNIPDNRFLNLGLYVSKNDVLERIMNNTKRTISYKDSLTFIFYSRHFVDSSKATQQQFKPYIEKMLAENKDTLHIGTVAEFKIKHKELFEKLTKGDSLSIESIKGYNLKGKPKGRERVIIPLHW